MMVILHAHDVFDTIKLEYGLFDTYDFVRCYVGRHLINAVKRHLIEDIMLYSP
jgi:hypothetical protein